MNNQILTCPIRGGLKSKTFAKDGLTFTEEYQRIQCVNFLLSKNYPKQCFKFEDIIWKLGNNAKNNLRADIAIVDENDDNKIIRAALYIRVSTDEQAKHGYSIESQKTRLREWCKEHHYQVVDIYADEGKSARTKISNRKELLRKNIEMLFYKENDSFILYENRK